MSINNSTNHIMPKNDNLKSRRLSTVIGVTFALFFLIFSFVGLIWTYLTTNQLIGKQLSNTFEQRFSIVVNIIFHQEELILYSLRAIKSNKYLSEQIIQGNSNLTQKILIDTLGSTVDSPLDILFFSDLDNTVFADASSPFFNPGPILSLIIEHRSSLLYKGELLHLKKNGTDLTMLVRAVKLTNEQTGKVIGTLYGGIVMNDNMSLLEQIRRETYSGAVLLLSDDVFVGSTELKESAITKMMTDHEHSMEDTIPSWFRNINSPANDLISSPRKVLPQGMSTVVQIVFAVPNKILVDIRNSYLKKAFWLVVGALVFLLLSISVVRWLTLLPFKNLLKYSNEIFTGRMKSTYQFGSIKEFNQLGEAMEKMVGGLRDANEQLQLDIVARRQAEKDLQSSEAFLNSVIDNIPNMIFVKDAKDLRFVRFNKAGEELLGYSKEDLLGKCDYDFFPKEEADFFTSKDLKVLTEKTLADVPEEPVQTKEKGIRILHTKKIPIFDEKGTPLFLLGISEDITARKQAEEEKNILKSKLHQAQKMEAIGLMAGGVAHDLNNILAGIVGYPELLLQKLPQDSELRKPLEAIHESGNRAAKVVADLLTVARGAASTKEVHNLNSLTQEYLNSPEGKHLKTLYPKISIRCQFVATQSYILCSPVHVKKCLMNLVINATEAIADAGEITIIIYNHSVSRADRTKRDLEEGDYVVLSIQDTGSGISATDLEHIFEPFYTKKEMGRSGTGLGLTVVWNTMEAHNGKIFVKRIDSKTCFQLYFPVNNGEKEVQSQSIRAKEHVGNNEHILVVDDEPQLRDIAIQMLRSMGYIGDSVQSGELAIEFVKKTPVDLIVIDMLMGSGLNGRQTYEKILKIHPNQKAIITSGFSESDDVKETLQLGASGFIKKPYSMQQLGRAVKETLSI